MSARQAVADVLISLGYKPKWREVFADGNTDVTGILRRQIDKCKGVIQLVGYCYGSEQAKPDVRFGRISYTQYEALYAKQRGKRVWHLFVGQNFPTDPAEKESADVQKLQSAYRRRLQVVDAHLFPSIESREALEANIIKLSADLARLRS